MAYAQACHPPGLLLSCNVGPLEKLFHTLSSSLPHHAIVWFLPRMLTTVVMVGNQPAWRRVYLIVKLLFAFRLVAIAFIAAIASSHAPCKCSKAFRDSASLAGEIPIPLHMVGAQNRIRARECGIEFQGLFGRGIRLGSGVIGVNAKRKFMKDANGHWSKSAAISQRPCATRRISTSAFFRQYIMTYSPTGKLRAPTPKSSSRAAQVGMACKKEKSVGDGIDQAVGDFKATALFAM